MKVLSGQDYRSYVAEHIFRPAGMDAAHADDDCRPDDPCQAIGYVAVAAERIPNCFAALDGTWPAGGQSFAARDMLRFVTALRQGRLGVPHALFEQATTPKLTYFGLCLLPLTMVTAICPVISVGVTAACSRGNAWTYGLMR